MDVPRPAPSEVLGLPDASPGVYEVVRVSDAEASRLAWLGAAGLVPGAVVLVAVSDGSLVVETAGEPVAVTAEDAAAVLVRRAR
ncbi:MAG: ferrous iron transport protein A [Micrococcales bacterium]|nr:ferrous iron transport protein A [Micrococcales bacterium]